VAQRIDPYLTSSLQGYKVGLSVQAVLGFHKIDSGPDLALHF
jgi:hypothetical protein